MAFSQGTRSYLAKNENSRKHETESMKPWRRRNEILFYIHGIIKFCVRKWKKNFFPTLTVPCDDDNRASSCFSYCWYIFCSLWGKYCIGFIAWRASKIFIELFSRFRVVIRGQWKCVEAKWTETQFISPQTFKAPHILGFRDFHQTSNNIYVLLMLLNVNCFGKSLDLFDFFPRVISTINFT